MITRTALAATTAIRTDGAFDKSARLLETYIALRLQEQEHCQEVEQARTLDEIRAETQRTCDVMRTGTWVLQHDCRDMLRGHRLVGAQMSPHKLRARRLLALSQEALSQIDVHESELKGAQDVAEAKRSSDSHHSYMSVILDDMAQLLGEPEWTGVH